MRSTFGFVAIAISTIQIATIQTITVAKPVSNLNQIAKEVSVSVGVMDSYGREPVGAIVKKDRDLYSVLLNIQTEKTAKYVTTFDGQKHPLIRIKNYDNKGRNYDNSLSAIYRSYVDRDDGIYYSIVKFRSSKNYPVVELGDSNAIGKNDEIYVSGHRSGKIFIQPNRVVSNNYNLFLYDNNQYSPQHNNELIFNDRSELIGFHSIDKWSIDDERFWPEYHDYPYPTRDSLLQIYYTSQWMPDVCGNYHKGIGRRAMAERYRYHRGETISSLNLPIKKLGLNVKGSRNSQFQSIKSKDNFATVPNSIISFNLAGGEILAELDRAISLNPQDSISLFIRSNLKTSNKDYRGALADLDRLVALQPNSSGFYYYRGYLKQHYLKDLSGALADYDRLVELNPNDPKVYLNRGLLQEQDIHNFQAALADYNRLLEVERIPTSDSSSDLDRTSPIYYFIARLKAEKMKDFPGALADYNRAIQGNSHNHLIYQQRGAVKAQLKDLNGALADYDFAVNMKHSSASSWGNNQAIQDRKVIRAKFKVDYLNDLAGALVDYNKAVELNPSGETYYERGIFMSTYRKDRAAAKADFQKAIELLNNLEYKDEPDLELLKKVKLALSN
jgi:tetratricopeptide (TPR) repeat protein